MNKLRPSVALPEALVNNKLRRFLVILCVGMLSVTSPFARAGLVNDVPSCYAAFHLSAQPSPDKLAYILIDQTVELDADLRQSVFDNISRIIQPGSKFVVAEFSAFSQGHYLQVMHTGIVETPLDEAGYANIPITKAPEIRTCFSQQLAFARKMALGTTKQIMETSSSSLAQSDIMAAVQSVGQAIRNDPATRKVLFLVTDALENSSITSFYANNTVRDINPSAELDKARSNRMLADLGGAKVYMLGSAIMPAAKTGTSAARNGYREPPILRDLHTFWQGYFHESKAQLIEFGRPAMVNPVSY